MARQPHDCRFVENVRVVFPQNSDFVSRWSIDLKTRSLLEAAVMGMRAARDMASSAIKASLGAVPALPPEPETSLVRPIVNFNYQTVCANSNTGARQRRNHVVLPGSMRRINYYRQMRNASDGRYRGEIQCVAGVL